VYWGPREINSGGTGARRSPTGVPNAASQRDPEAVNLGEQQGAHRDAGDASNNAEEASAVDWMV
jgi:hypothetical protein